MKMHEQVLECSGNLQTQHKIISDNFVNSNTEFKDPIMRYRSIPRFTFCDFDILQAFWTQQMSLQNEELVKYATERLHIPSLDPSSGYEIPQAIDLANLKKMLAVIYSEFIDEDCNLLNFLKLFKRNFETRRERRGDAREYLLLRNIEVQFTFEFVIHVLELLVIYVKKGKRDLTSVVFTFCYEILNLIRYEEFLQVINVMTLMNISDLCDHLMKLLPGLKKTKEHRKLNALFWKILFYITWENPISIEKKMKRTYQRLMPVSNCFTVNGINRRRRLQWKKQLEQITSLDDFTKQQDTCAKCRQSVERNDFFVIICGHWLCTNCIERTVEQIKTP